MSRLELWVYLCHSLFILLFIYRVLLVATAVDASSFFCPPLLYLFTEIFRQKHISSVVQDLQFATLCSLTLPTSECASPSHNLSRPGKWNKSGNFLVVVQLINKPMWAQISWNIEHREWFDCSFCHSLNNYADAACCAWCLADDDPGPPRMGGASSAATTTSGATTVATCVESSTAADGDGGEVVCDRRCSATWDEFPSLFFIAFQLPRLGKFMISWAIFWLLYNWFESVNQLYNNQKIAKQVIFAQPC